MRLNFSCGRLLKISELFSERVGAVDFFCHPVGEFSQFYGATVHQLVASLRGPGAAAADNDTTLDQVIEEYVYAPTGSEPTTKSLLILDETVGSGKTAAAILHHLRAAGLPSDCKVTIATALKVEK